MSPWSRAVAVLGITPVLVLVPLVARAEVVCRWFGHCVYESPGFRFTVVDKDTGQPLVDVHALAEWVLNGAHGRNGPLMVQDAVTGADGVASFPAWGPIPGSKLGLHLNLDPAVSLFKAGYLSLVVQNAYPKDMNETTRVRRFGQDGRTFVLSRFGGTPRESFAALQQAADRGTTGRISEAQLREFATPYLNRKRRILAEMQALGIEDADVATYVNAFQRDLQRLEEAAR